MLQAYRNVDCTIKALRDVSRDFDGINASAKKFVEWANNSLEDLKIDVTVEATLPEKRVRVPKAISGERRTHEAVGDRAIDCYRITVHNCVMDSSENFGRTL